MPTYMHQTRMRSPSNLPIMEPHSACRSRIPTMVFAGSRFATLTATSCSSVDQGRRRGSDPGDIRSFGFLLFGLESPADPEHVAIRMAKVHLANVPRHIGRRKCDLQPGGDALLVHLVHIVHPDRHPDALVASRSITPTFHRKGQLPMFGLVFLPPSAHESRRLLALPFIPLAGYRWGLRLPFPALPVCCSAFRHWSASLALPTA